MADALTYQFFDRYEVILVVCRVMQEKSQCHSYYMDLTIYVFHVYSPEGGDATCAHCLCHKYNFNTSVTMLLYFESGGFCAQQGSVVCEKTYILGVIPTNNL